MKKILTLCAAALLALSSFAATGLNVYATGMTSTQADTLLTIGYTLNTQATSLYVVFFDANGEQYDAVILSADSLLTEGSHTATVALPEDMEPGTYTWGINAFGNPTAFADVCDAADGYFSYYLPQDVVVDNSPESPWFGQIYLCLPWVDTDGMTVTTQTQLPGVYVYNPQLALANYLQGYQGGITIGGKDRQTIKRMTVGPDGMVYIGGNNADVNPGVWCMNPADPSAWTAVLDPSTAASDYVKVAALEVVGTKLYTLCNISTETGLFNTYDLTATPYASRTATDMTMDKTLGNADCSIRYDGRGGFWVTQHRYALDAYSALMHWSMSAKGKATVDFAINNTADETIQALLDKNLNSHSLSYRGTLGVSPDGQFIAMGNDKTVKVFQVVYDAATGIPSLTEYCRTGTIGGNIDGIAFDYANNLYFASASVERMYVYPIAKEDNHCLAPAPKQYTVTVEEPSALEQTDALTDVQKVVEDGQVYIIRQGVRYTILGAEVK